MATGSTSCDGQLAQARSAAYTLVSCGFQYPDRTVVEVLADPPRWRSWPEILQENGARIRQLLQSVKQAVGVEADRLAADRNAEPAAIQERYDRLFGHAVRGKCPAYESEYGRGEIVQQAAQLADLAGFYRAFGMEIADAANGRPDHLTMECEFMAALCAKEAHGLALGDEENADVCVNAERAFLKDHLARWLPAFAHRVERADDTGLYGALARFANAFVKSECERFEIHAGPPMLELRPADPVLDRTICCGTVDRAAHEVNEQIVQLDLDPECGR